MKTEELLSRILKKEEDIDKLNKKIQKLENKRDSEKEFRKEYDYLSNFEERKDYYKECWIKYQEDEIRYARNRLKEATDTLNKYENMLAFNQDRESKPVIKIFKDFFEKWKQEIKDYTTPLYKKYLELDNELCDVFNNYQGPDRQDRVKDLRQKTKNLLKISWVHTRWEKGEQGFNEFLNKYMEDRYFELVDRISELAGEITDVSSLYVGVDGRINGIIIGTLGKVKIETIIAGGYNEDIIVNVKHGPCAHYRVLVHKIN